MRSRKENFHDGIWALVKDTPESHPASSTMWQRTICKPKAIPLPDTESISFDLSVPIVYNCEKQDLVFISHWVCGTSWQRSKWTETVALLPYWPLSETHRPAASGPHADLVPASLSSSSLFPLDLLKGSAHPASLFSSFLHPGSQQ